MALADSYLVILKRLPGITSPLKRLTFRDKLKWTGLILIIYFLMAQIIVYGVGESQMEQLRFLEILLGSSFGSIMSLGIGPIVTASIVLQLMVGSKIIPWDLQSENGKILFQGTQKLLAIILSFVEAIIFVNMGAVPAASPELAGLVILQLAIGGIIVIFMDEVISKWGFGSGVGLFIVAGVSKSIVVRTLNPLAINGVFPSPGNPPAGAIPFALTTLASGSLLESFLALLPVFATVIVFFLVVYANAIKVEIPLAFGSIRGFGRRWPLKYFYTSNIPVILMAALMANVNLMGVMMANSGNPIFGTFDISGNPESGLALLITPPRTHSLGGVMISAGAFALLGAVIAYYTRRRGLKMVLLFAILGGALWVIANTMLGNTSLLEIGIMDITRVISYTLVLAGGSTVFAYFWMTTAGMDSRSVANQIAGTGMQIPGYRRDPRIMEHVLKRYIPGLTIIGGASVGLLAAFADFTNAIGTGTGILLATMIVFQLYEELASQHLEDMHPSLRRFFE
ncbi:MAG: preprotein translocase subunit SecY [Candidatus Aenigmarchaeota archaeon]|nr:preprotein translocase subunit SecY [Candidatus Aenigmarchaeota archaeon]